MVRVVGVEPALLSELDLESNASWLACDKPAPAYALRSDL
jgi:hypothetical protein